MSVARNYAGEKRVTISMQEQYVVSDVQRESWEA